MIIITSSCGLFECENSVGGRYQFELPVSISPARDSFHIGDTITITSTFSKEVFERKTHKNFSLDDFYFYPFTKIVQLDTMIAYHGAIDFFDYIVCKNCEYDLSMFGDGSKTLEGQYMYDDDQYFLKLQFIPQQTGLFFLTQANSLHPLGDNQTFPGQCGSENISAVMNVNNGADNNRSLIFESEDNDIIVWATNGSGDRFADAGGYCFYVVE